MRKAIILSSLLLVATAAMAKVNLQEGYIITNENDTVYGVIDYRGDSKNAQVCKFRAEGEQAFKEYAPQQIKGYRLGGGGVYYVTRTVPVNGEDKTFFAEFLLEGGISLYHYKESGIDYFYFVDEEGKVSVVKDTHENDDRGTYQRLVDINKNKREGMNEGLQLFARSPKAVNKLWESNYVPSRLVQLTKEYDEEFCQSSGECIDYLQSEKKSALVKLRFRLEAGVVFGQFNYGSSYGYGLSNHDNKITTPQIGAGFDFLFPRFNKNISLQALLLLSHWEMKMSKTRMEITIPDYYKQEFTMAEIAIGPCYRFFSRSKVSPVVRAGFSTWYGSNVKAEHLDPFESASIGYYVGGGTDIDLGKHTLRVSANYEYRKNSGWNFTTPAVTVNAGFCF